MILHPRQPRTEKHVPSARAVRLAWLACEPDTAVDALAMITLDAIEHSRACSELLKQALALLADQDAKIDRQQATIAELRAHFRGEAAA